MSHSAYITRVAAFLPGPPVTNDELEPRLGFVQGRPSRARGPVLRSNGIRQRHYAIDPATGTATHTGAQLAAEAIRRLELSPEKWSALDALACATSLPDQLMPNHASMVHGELGNPPCEVVAPAGICLSGVAALKYAVMGVRSGDFRRAIASASERASAVMRGHLFDRDADLDAADVERRPTLAFEKDFLRFMLSDGAGAALVEPAPASQGLSLRVEWMFLRSFANEIGTCMYAGATRREDGGLTGWMDHPSADWAAASVFAVRQDARLLNEHIVHLTVERGLEALRRTHPVSADTITWFLPHYSSEYFRDKLAAGLARADFVIPESRWFTNLTTRGNTGSASIYIMLDELLRSDRLRPGDHVLCYVPESGRFATGFFLLQACEATSP